MNSMRRAVLVGVNLNSQQDFEDSMQELAQLAEACDIEVAGRIDQNLNQENKVQYIGKGKVQEVLALIDANDADAAIFNDELSPSQIRNLETVLNCEIIDRTVLILDIFAQRAKTTEAKLQVEIAKMQYMLPRLVGLRDALSRQGGGSGFINRGSGETKLELDHRKIEDKISRLKRELSSLTVNRQNQRRRRKKTGIPAVALVGYTNAGKSTVMNAMLNMYDASEDKQVYEKNMLFATLETSVRNIKLPDNKEFLLTDTVGFISKLPHHLIKAFRSTLEEVAEADMLIHVVDFSNPNHNKQITVTEETLKELGANEIPVLYSYNKIDVASEEIPKAKEDCIYISARTGEGMDKLVDIIVQTVFPQYISCDMLIPYNKGNMVSYFKDHANIKSMEHLNDGILVTLECSKADYERYNGYVK